MKNFLGKTVKLSIGSRKAKLIGELVVTFVVIVAIIVMIIIAITKATENYSSINQKLISDELRTSLSKGSESNLQQTEMGLWAGIFDHKDTNSKISAVYEATPCPLAGHAVWDWVSNKNIDSTTCGCFLSWDPHEKELDIYFSFLITKGIIISGHFSNLVVSTMGMKPSVDWFKNSCSLVKLINMNLDQFDGKDNTYGLVWESK